MPPKPKPVEPAPSHLRTIDTTRLTELDAACDRIAIELGFSHAHVQVNETDTDYGVVVVQFIQLEDPRKHKSNNDVKSNQDRGSGKNKAVPTRKRVS